MPTSTEIWHSIPKWLALFMGETQAYEDQYDTSMTHICATRPQQVKKDNHVASGHFTKKQN